MLPLSRRDLLKSNSALAVIPVLLSSLGCQQLESESEGRVEDKDSAQPVTKSEQGSSYETDMAKVKVQYLEMVTPEMDALIAQYEKTHGVKFSEPNAAFGGARTINLDGGLLGVRKPLRESETPVIRPYMLVDDIAAAVTAASEAGAMIAMGPTPMPGNGQFAIVIHGGIECGFWQN